MSTIKHVFNDGGRKYYFDGKDTGDCVTRAIAIAMELDYKEVYDELFQLIKERQLKVNIKNRSKYSSPREGVMKDVWKPYIESKGWKWVPTMKIGSGCKVHLTESELPKGRLIVRVSNHLACVIDGVLHDTYDCSREGTRCVYGYFIKE